MEYPKLLVKSGTRSNNELVLFNNYQELSFHFNEWLRKYQDNNTGVVVSRTKKSLTFADGSTIYLKTVSDNIDGYEFGMIDISRVMNYWLSRLR